MTYPTSLNQVREIASRMFEDRAVHSVNVVLQLGGTLLEVIAFRDGTIYEANRPRDYEHKMVGE